MQTFENIEVVVCLRDPSHERALRQRFSKAMPEAHVRVVPGQPSTFGDLISVSGEMDGPEKPLVKAQDVMGEFNSELKRTNTACDA